MRIGIAYDLRTEIAVDSHEPEDALEEYDAPETVAAVASALKSLGHTVVPLGGGREFITHILLNSVDFVFNLAEGRGNYRSREAQVPAILEMLDRPYSGSDPECLAICLDKPLAKVLLQSAGIRTPAGQIVNTRRELKSTSWNTFPLPAIVKPAYEGSSKGIRLSSRADTPEQIVELAGILLERYHQPVLVEEFIRGYEVTVGVGGLPPRVIGTMGIRSRQQEDPDFVYSLEVKRDWERLVSYECPAKVSPSTARQITRSALKAFRVLGCRDIARIDFRIDMTGKPYLIEVNPLPGLHPGYSDLPIMAEGAGHSYTALIELILDSAIRRQRLCSARSE